MEICYVAVLCAMGVAMCFSMRIMSTLARRSLSSYPGMKLRLNNIYLGTQVLVLICINLFQMAITVEDGLVSNVSLHVMSL